MKAQLYYANWSAMRAENLYPHDGTVHPRRFYETVSSREVHEGLDVGEGLTGCEQLFMAFNADDRPDGQYRRSMSVGDIVIDTERYIGWVCAPAGFDELTPKQFSGFQCECGVLNTDAYASVGACDQCGPRLSGPFSAWRGRTVEIALDPASDLRDAGLCACDQCADAFAASFLDTAETWAAERGLEIEVVRCVYGSSEAWACERGELARQCWQALHDSTPWGADDAACGG